MSFPNFKCGLSENLLARFSINSTATSRSWMMTIVWPGTVIELRGP